MGGAGPTSVLIPHPPFHPHLAPVALKENGPGIEQLEATELRPRVLVPELELSIVPVFPEVEWLADDERGCGCEEPPGQLAALLDVALELASQRLRGVVENVPLQQLTVHL